LIPTKDNQFKLCDTMVVTEGDVYHVVPSGFKTDLASIPRVFWPVFSPGDYDTIAPAVLHDWHYCCVSSVSRKRADDIFYYGLVGQGMHPYKAFMYWYTIRWWGWIWYQHGRGLSKHAIELIDNQNQGEQDDFD